MRHSKPASCVMTAREELLMRARVCVFDVLKLVRVCVCMHAQVASVIKVISA